jgi:sigma-E factor negative regulatory protein RseC
VKILITKSMGLKALFLGYLLPFLMVLFLLVLTKIVGMNDLVSGLVSLSVLMPYYLCLYLCREKVNKQFIFTLTKLN